MAARLRLLLFLLLAVALAYGQAPATPAAAPSGTITIPAGTTLTAVFVQPLATRDAAKGAAVYLQTTFPVIAGTASVIPTGAYLRGTLASATGHGVFSRSYDLGVTHATLTFPDGYTLAVAGQLRLTPSAAEGTIQPSGPGAASATLVASGAALGGTAIGAALGGPATPAGGFSRVRGAAIGGAVGIVAGLIVGVAMIAHANVTIGVGTPVQVQLPSALAVAANQPQPAGATGAAPPVAAAPLRMCYDPGTPGTPDTVIPGTPAVPGTPPTVIPGPPGTPPTVIPGTPGTPGTPDTVIPGTPGTPARYYPCPR